MARTKTQQKTRKVTVIPFGQLAAGGAAGTLGAILCWRYAPMGLSAALGGASALAAGAMRPKMKALPIGAAVPLLAGDALRATNRFLGSREAPKMLASEPEAGGLAEVRALQAQLAALQQHAGLHAVPGGVQTAY